MLVTKTVAEWIVLMEHAPETEAGLDFSATIDDACDGRDMTETLTIDVDTTTLAETEEAQRA